MKKLILLALIPILWIGCQNQNEEKNTQELSNDFKQAFSKQILKMEGGIRSLKKEPLLIKVSDSLGAGLIAAFELLPNIYRQTFDNNAINYSPYTIHHSQFNTYLKLVIGDTLFQYFAVNNNRLKLIFTKDHTNYYELDNGGSLVSGTIADTLGFYNLFPATNHTRFLWTKIDSASLAFIQDTTIQTWDIHFGYVDSIIVPVLTSPNEIAYVTHYHTSLTAVSILNKGAIAHYRDANKICPPECSGY